MIGPQSPAKPDPFATALTKATRDGRISPAEEKSLATVAKQTATNDDDAFVHVLKDKKSASASFGTPGTTVSLVSETESGKPEYQIILTPETVTNANVDTYCVQLTLAMEAEKATIDASPKSDKDKLAAKLAVSTKGTEDVTKAMNRFPNAASTAHQTLDRLAFDLEKERAMMTEE